MRVCTHCPRAVQSPVTRKCEHPASSGSHGLAPGPASSGGRAATVSTADADRRAHPNIEFQQKSSPFQGPDLGSLFEMLKYEMRRKTTRGDVLRLVHSHLKQVAEVIEREFNVLRGQLVVQSAHSTAQRHYERLGAEAVAEHRGQLGGRHHRAHCG